MVVHPYPALGAYEMVLALVAVPVLRAVLLPSTGVRTFALDACSDAHAWSEADALRWWAERSEVLSAARAKATQSSPPTLVVDLKQRATFAPTLPNLRRATAPRAHGPEVPAEP